MLTLLKGGFNSDLHDRIFGEIKKRTDNFQCHNWHGIYLQISVLARKTLLNTYILANDKQWLFLSGSENFTGTELAEILNQVEPASIYKHFQDR